MCGGCSWLGIGYDRVNCVVVGWFMLLKLFIFMMMCFGVFFLFGVIFRMCMCSGWLFFFLSIYGFVS